MHSISTSIPLLWFDLFRRRVEIDALAQLGGEGGCGYELVTLRTSLDFANDTSVIDSVYDYITAGDSYQVNLTQSVTVNTTGGTTNSHGWTGTRTPMASTMAR